ncbi:MAG TPA: phosphatase PAP2 family protein [Stellaceae bacterium]
MSAKRGLLTRAAEHGFNAPPLPAARAAAGPRTAVRAAWIAIAALGLADIAWARHDGIIFVHAEIYVAGVLLLLSAAGAWRLQRAGAGFARITEAMAQFLAFLPVSASLSYLCATIAGPLQDARFVALDRALGFDWAQWAAAVAPAPGLPLLLALAYVSYIPHFTLAIGYYAAIGRSERCAELLWLLIIALLPTMAGFIALPVAGPWVHYDVAAELDSFPVTFFAALRADNVHVIDLLQVDGIVGFPSFHAVYAVLLTYIHRGYRRLFLVALAVNAMMLLSLPVPGGHYLADIIAGLAVAGVAIAVWSLLRRRWRERPPYPSLP